MAKALRKQQQRLHTRIEKTAKGAKVPGSMNAHKGTQAPAEKKNVAGRSRAAVPHTSTRKKVEHGDS